MCDNYRVNNSVSIRFVAEGNPMYSHDVCIFLVPRVSIQTNRSVYCLCIGFFFHERAWNKNYVVLFDMNKFEKNIRSLREKRNFQEASREVTFKIVCSLT